MTSAVSGVKINKLIGVNMNLINKIHSLFIRPQFIYGDIIQSGKIRSGKYRINNYTGDVEFVLGRDEKYEKWHRMDQSWKVSFVPFSRN